jgi:hypothetical protein
MVRRGDLNVHSFLLHLEKGTFMITKKHLNETIKKLILLDKIERAEKESGRGETITEEALDRELEKWFK